MGGGHPEAAPPAEAAPPKPGWRGTVLNGAWFAGVVGLTISPWAAFGVVALTAVAATAEHWAWERASHDGPGWRPLSVAFWSVVGAVAVLALALQSGDLFFGSTAFFIPLGSSLEQIGRGIRASRDGAPRPVRDD
jgi:hypothetical protein